MGGGGVNAEKALNFTLMEVNLIEMYLTGNLKNNFVAAIRQRMDQATNVPGTRFPVTIVSNNYWIMIIII